MKRILSLLIVCFYAVSSFAQSNELQKISKYIVSTSGKSYLYEEPKLNSRCLALILPLDAGDGYVYFSELSWQSPATKEKHISLLTASVLPVIYETDDWYFVYHTVASTPMQDSKTAYVPKKDFVESPLVDINEQGMSKATGLNVSIRNSGRYKDYIFLWGKKDYTTELAIGQIIDHSAYIFGYLSYMIDDDKQVILCDEYEGSDETVNLGKKYYSSITCDADFRSLTDADIDRILPYYYQSYTSMYIQVRDAQEACLVNLDSLSEVKVVREESPEFPGGEEAFFRWIYQNINYPKQAQENGANGRVSVSFVVDVDGTVKDVKVVRPVDPALDKEAIRVIKSMPKWKPGKRNGVPIPVTYTTPITFKI